MPESTLRLVGMVGMFAGGLAGVVAWPPGMAAIPVAAAFVLGYSVTMPGASGRRVSPVLGVAGAIALIADGAPVFVLGVGALALPFGYLVVHLRHGPRVAADLFPAEPVGVLGFAAAFGFGVMWVPPAHPAVLAVFAASAAIGFMAIVAARTVWARERGGTARRLAALRSIEDWPAYASVCSAAALFAVTLDALGPWSIPLAGLPYLFAHVSLHRLNETRRTYDQTIRALGAIPEAGGLVSIGHSARTAELAVAAGVEIGMGIAELRRLEYAALLHDVGRLVLANPAVSGDDYSFSDVAGWSAAIIGEARFLEPVAELVSLQHSPYRREGEVRDPAVPRASQLVRIAARYDSATADGVAPMDAVELLHRGAAYDYDPEFVMALRRVLERWGTLAA